MGRASARSSSVEKPQRCCIDPTSFGESATPLRRHDIPRFVPSGVLAPIEEFPQAGPRVGESSTFEQRLSEHRVAAGVADNCMEERGVSTKAFGVDGRASVDVCPLVDQPIKDLSLPKIDGQVQ